MPLLAVSLPGTTVICCTGMLLFPGNTPALLPQHSQYVAPSCPQILAPASDRCPIHRRFSGKGDGAPGLLSLISPILIIKRSGDGTGLGHRGNRKTDLEMVGCEVVMTTGKLLNSAHHHLLLLPLLFLCPPAERRREEELRWS